MVINISPSDGNKYIKWIWCSSVTSGWSSKNLPGFSSAAKVKLEKKKVKKNTNNFFKENYWPWTVRVTVGGAACNPASVQDASLSSFTATEVSNATKTVGLDPATGV